MERSDRAWMPAVAMLFLLGTSVPGALAQPAAPPPATPVGLVQSGGGGRVGDLSVSPPTTATPGGSPTGIGDLPNATQASPSPGTAPTGIGSLPSLTPPMPQPGGSTTGGGAPPALPPGTPRPGGTTANNARLFSESPLATNLTLKAAPFEPTDVRFPINLATALRLSDARPLIVAAAQASVWVAEAELFRSKLLFIPTLNIGFDYLRHDGGGPDFNKGIMTAPSVNFFYGGGGLVGQLSSTDALFQPLVARRALTAAQWEIQTAKNNALQQTADAYFRVTQHRGTYAGALYSVERGRELVERIDNLSKEFVPIVEVDRARNMLADLEQIAVTERQEWRVASADLTQVLRLDPRAVLEPIEHDHVQITLIDPGRRLDELMPIALVNRPELASHQAMVQSMMETIRREKWRPLLPMVMLNGFQTPNELLQAGIFGIGPNSSMNQWKGRFDFSIQPLWQWEAMGLGNLARIKQQRGIESKAIIEFFKTQDAVAADVTRAQARVQSAAARVLQADRAMRTAIITFNGNYEGLRQTTRLGNVLVLVNRPQEAVFALQLLMVAFNEYFTTVADYNRSQFELFHALGYPANELAQLRPPGQIMPVNTDRPAFLPPVGTGPPPATR